MSNDLPIIEISLTSRFKKDISKLAKRFRSIRHTPINDLAKGCYNP